MRRDEETLMLSPLPEGVEHDTRAGAQRGAVVGGSQGLKCATPCIGVRSVGDTHFGQTLFGNTSLGGEVLQKEECGKNTGFAGATSENFTRRELSSFRFKRLRQIQWRPPTWCWGLSAGLLAGLVAAMSLGSSQSGVDVLLKENEHPRDEARAKDLSSRAGTNSKVDVNLKDEVSLSADAIRETQSRAIRLMLAGQCAESVSLYRTLSNESSMKADEVESTQWELFVRSAEGICVPPQGGLP